MKMPTLRSQFKNCSFSWLDCRKMESTQKWLTFCKYPATLDGTFSITKLCTESVKAMANTLLWKWEKYRVAYKRTKLLIKI